MDVEFVARDTLPPDFFSLDAIGYTEACRTYERGCETPAPPP